MVKVVLDLGWSPLSAPEEMAHISNEFRFVSGTLSPNRIGFDVLVEQLIWIQFRAIARQEEEANLPAMQIRPAFYGGRNMHRMSIYNEEGFSPAVANQPPQEGYKHRRVEPSVKDHECQLSSIGDC